MYPFQCLKLTYVPACREKKISDCCYDVFDHKCMHAHCPITDSGQLINLFMEFAQLTLDGAEVLKFGINESPGGIIWYYGST